MADRLQLERARQAARRASCPDCRRDGSARHAVVRLCERRTTDRLEDHQRPLNTRFARQPRSRGERRARSRSGRGADEHGRPLAVVLFNRAFHGRSTIVLRSNDVASEWTVGAGAARERQPVRVDRRSRVRRADDWLGARADARAEVHRHSRAIRVGRRGDAAVRAVRAVDDLRRRLRAGGVAMELPAADRGGRRSRNCRWAGCGRRSAIPEKTSRGNFTAHWGGGVRRRPRGDQRYCSRIAFSISRTAISLASNPGVNSHVLLAGWSRRQ